MRHEDHEAFCFSSWPSWLLARRRARIEPQRPAHPRMIAQLVERGRVVQAAIRHNEMDRVAVPDVFERVAIEHDQVGELAHFDRPELLVEAEISRAVDRRRLERLEWRHSALLEHPELPVRPETLELPVRAELDAAARVGNLLGAAS